MTPWLRPAYTAAGRIAEWLAATVPAGASPKLARVFSRRRGITDRYRDWANAHRDRSRPLLWLHAASVGEALMALPVAERVRTALPNVQIAFTFFSPSVERVAKENRMSADFADYLPFDSNRSMRAALEALAPTALVFVKGDVWPALVAESALQGVRLGLISASMPRRSRRATTLRCMLTRDAYREIDVIGAASEDDARALVRAGAQPASVSVTGDTRYDQAWTRAHVSPRNRDTVASLDDGRNSRTTIVAGSTWRDDEAALIPAFERLHASMPSVRLIIAPHEVARTSIEAIEARARNAGLNIARLNSPSADDADVIVVDSIGVLADLYELATVAYVGGGFHDAGLHSLVEPAVFRVPTVIGPNHASSRDARLMLMAGGVVSADTSEAMFTAMRRILTDADYRTSMSDAIGLVVTSELGAADRSFQMVRKLLRTV